ncbi:hypothetical protein HDG35_005812 [Paraburkholderia sp. JPY681]|nr:hypothetical protein [Paraburkholderia atlantica]
MFKEPNPGYTAKFTETAVQQGKDGQVVSAVARELGTSAQPVRIWLKAYSGGNLNALERRSLRWNRWELSQLRMKYKRLQIELEIPKWPQRSSRRSSGEVRMNRHAQCPQYPLPAQLTDARGR